MGPSEDRSTHRQNQDTIKAKTQWRKRRARHVRSRVCLLKGCTRTFRPEHPLTRYCSEQCREQARRWRQWKARHRYRQSVRGKQNRQSQSRRYRLRRKREAANNGDCTGGEGHHKKSFFRARVIARGATKSSSVAGGRRCSGSVPTRVVVLWNGLLSERGVGENASPPGDENRSI